MAKLYVRNHAARVGDALTAGGVQYETTAGDDGVTIFSVPTEDHTKALGLAREAVRTRIAEIQADFKRRFP